MNRLRKKSLAFVKVDLNWLRDLRAALMNNCLHIYSCTSYLIQVSTNFVVFLFVQRIYWKFVCFENSLCNRSESKWIENAVEEFVNWRQSTNNYIRICSNQLNVYQKQTIIKPNVLVIKDKNTSKAIVFLYYSNNIASKR